MNDGAMDGQALLEALSTLPRGMPAAALLRHAARHPIVDSTQPTLAEITPAGAEAAEKMGRQLNGYSEVRIFHSPVKRCQQTAEALARGAQAAGLRLGCVRPEPALGVDYILDLVKAGQLTDLHGERFVRLWLQGEIPEGVVEPAPMLARNKLAFLSATLRETGAAPGRLDLHVTHDWNILVLRELTLGLRHEDLGWMSFLDGLALSLQGDAMEIVCRHRRVQLPLASA